MSSFLPQYERMKRWYVRFGQLDKGRAHDEPSEDYLDEIYSFFQNCYHFKDWIKNDDSLDLSVRNGVEAHVNANRSLRLCADICNSLKHLKLTSSRSGEDPEFGTKRFKLELGAGPPTISMKCEVDTSNGPLDAYELATECMSAWETFLTDNQLK